MLSAKTAGDIDKHVARVLRGLGDPEPPLRLEDVRELLKLDLQFYQAHDPGFAQEMVSRIKVGARQVIARPTLLIDAIRKLSLKALYVPDRKRILIDQDLPPLKLRWNEAHEVGHSLLPWHEAIMHGDTQHTLSQACHEQVEAEANFAAGKLLFLGERGADELRSLAPTIESVKQIKARYGNTISTTLYHMVERASLGRAMVGCMSGHPHPSRRKGDFDPAHPCKHLVFSPEFDAQFGHYTGAKIFDLIASYCGAQSGGPLGAAEILLTDVNGDQHVFDFETFFNRYDALTLGVYKSRLAIRLSQF